MLKDVGSKQQAVAEMGNLDWKKPRNEAIKYSEKTWENGIIMELSMEKWDYEGIIHEKMGLSWNAKKYWD